MDTAKDLYPEMEPVPPPLWEKYPRACAVAAVFVLTVVLTVVSFPPFSTPEFAYALAVPGIFWAYRRPSFKLYAWTLGAAQTVAWGYLLFWVHHVSWLGWVLLAPVVGVWVGVWYAAVWWAMPRFLGRSAPLRIAGMLGLAGLWVLLEWSRTWFLSGFPWLPLGASQWQRNLLLQIASYTGTYGISFMLITFNIGFAAYGHRLFFEKAKGLKRRSQEFMMALVVLMFMAFLPLREVFGQQRESLARISVVQPYIPQDVKWDPSKAQGILEVLESTTRKTAARYPDLIVWPEAVMPMQVEGSPQAQQWIESLVGQIKTPLLLGSDAVVTDDAGARQWYNGAYWVDPEQGLQRPGYAKRHLVPFGEYVPLRPVLGWLSKVVPVGESDFQPGSSATPMVISTRRGPIVGGVLICYEDIYPGLARETTQAGAKVLFVLSNSAWFGEGAAARQHMAHSVLRAVENRRPVVRSSNSGWSGWIDEYGNVRSQLTNDEGSIFVRGAKVFEVTRDLRWDGVESIYTRYGDWILWVAAGLVGFGWAALALTSATVAPKEET